MDVTKLSDQELVDVVGAAIREGEKRARAQEHYRLASQLDVLHARAHRTAQLVKSAGLIETFSGDDKDGPPTGP